MMSITKDRPEYFTIRDNIVVENFEFQFSNGGDWVKGTFRSSLPIEHRLSYLTAEQLEKESWKITIREFKTSPYHCDWVVAYKEGYKLTINLALTEHMLMNIYQGEEYRIFQGKVPCINTFRQVCKLLEINKTKV